MIDIRGLTDGIIFSCVSESKFWGHEVKLRPHRDQSRDLVLLPDPTQTALCDDVIRGWHLFANIISVQHALHLQVWRPAAAHERGRTAGASRKKDTSSSEEENNGGGSGGGGGGGGIAAYTLVGQTYYRPPELRGQEFRLLSHETIAVREGDVLGFQLASRNPLAWSAVPCADDGQRFRFHETSDAIRVGSKVNFTSAPPGDDACRQYSLAAILCE